MKPVIAHGVLGVIAIVAVTLSGAFASDGVIVKRDDDRNTFIPDELTMKLRLKAAFNDENMHWRFEWDARDPSFAHDYFVFENGDWTRYGDADIGEEPLGLSEDRISFFVDDGSVEHFDRYGGFLTVSSGMVSLSSEVGSDETEPAIGRPDLRKFLPETRRDPTDWTTVRSDEELAAMQEAGYFLDLWHWRAHRSNPVGFADDQYVLDFRLNDPGRGPFTTNVDGETGLPAFMFDVEATGQYAMSWDRLRNGEYTQDDWYYLSEEIAVPFDPDRDWQEGDVIPRRLVRVPDGSRGSIFANGTWADDIWRVDLMRALDTESPLDDKILRHGGKYQVAFAVHKNATGARWHYIGMPYTLGLSRDAQIEATYFSGGQPPWDQIEWVEMTLIYPGQITWDHLISDGHAGAAAMREGKPFEMAHKLEDMAFYAVESEFRSEIRDQWYWTIASVTAFFVLFSVGWILASRAADRKTIAGGKS